MFNYAVISIEKYRDHGYNKYAGKEDDAMIENISVTIDTAAPLIAKIESFGRAVNEDVYKNSLGVYRKFRKIVLQNGGDIKTTGVLDDTVKIVAEVPDMDLFREGLTLFSELLTMVDSIDISTTKDGDLSIEVGVANLWKAV